MRTIFVSLMMLLLSVAVQASDIVGPARVIDGDTIFIGDVTFRIHGIDAPETNQFCQRNFEHWPCGKEATEHLWNLIGDGEVTCDNLGSDRYGRMIGKCSVHGVDIGGAMVDAGLALAYRRYSRDYVPNEMEARARGAGMFGGSYMPPWEWRRR